VKDERLRKCVILGGSATVGTRANNELRVHHSFPKLKNLTNKSVEKKSTGVQGRYFGSLTNSGAACSLTAASVQDSKR